MPTSGLCVHDMPDVDSRIVFLLIVETEWFEKLRNVKWKCGISKVLIL